VKAGLPAAIFATCCCCLPCGIAALVFASQVNTFVAIGKHQEARIAARKAKMWTKVSIVSAVVVWAIYGAMVMIAAVNGR